MRVAITTSSDRVQEVAPVFEGQGFTPVATPCVTVTPHPEAADTIRKAVHADSVIVIASRRALDICWPSHVPEARWLAVGSRTADAIAERGGSRIISGTAGLRDLLANHDIAGEDVIFPHSSRTDLSVLDLLAAARSLHSGIVYTTTPIKPPAAAVEAAVFGSPSAVMGWSLGRNFSGLLVGAIGPTTTAALNDYGVEPDAVASTPTYVSLATALRELHTNRGNP